MAIATYLLELPSDSSHRVLVLGVTSHHRVDNANRKRKVKPNTMATSAV